MMYFENEMQICPMMQHLFCLGTVSVMYLIFLVTLKAIQLGFHLEFHWFHSNDFFVAGKVVFIDMISLGRS